MKRWRMEGVKDVGAEVASAFYNVKHIDIGMEEASRDRARVPESPSMSR